MGNKMKVIMPIVIALGIALSGSIFLMKWLDAMTVPEEVVKVESEAFPVVVALYDLVWGTKLDKEMMKTVPFIKDSLPTGHFTDLSALEGRVIIAPLKLNDPITESKLAPESVTVGGVAAIVKKGKRAIAVKGDKVLGLSGFIRPGNRVDVLVTLTHPDTKKEVTKVVLENIPVLATGTEVQKDGKGKPAPVDVYTLEVDPEEGEKLSLAATKGRLHFALRNATDSTTVLTKGATIPKTLASYYGGTVKKGIGNKKGRPKTRTHTVEAISGDKVTKKKFKVRRDRKPRGG
jgi:pilus assembly protein CpaB